MTKPLADLVAHWIAQLEAAERADLDGLYAAQMSTLFHPGADLDEVAAAIMLTATFESLRYYSGTSAAAS